MITWDDLRTAAVLGTARRPLALDGAADQPLPPSDIGSAEPSILGAAALLGAQRRAGQLPQTGLAPVEPLPPHEPERPMPATAGQLLELIVSGNLGRPTDADPLLVHWMGAAAAAGCCVPHHDLVPVLDRATRAEHLRPAVRPALGARGSWLAAQRDEWAWAATTPDAGTVEVHAEQFATGTVAMRTAALQAVRGLDPAAGRDLLATTWSTDNAAARAALLGALVVGLGPDDEALLDASLDDRAATVRQTAAAGLDRLPTSRRALRLRAVLQPLIDHRSGILRKRLSLAPLPADVDLARDLPGSSAADRRQRLVRATPLATWTDLTRLDPSALLALSVDPEDLPAWWAMAAVDQADQAWLHALAATRPTATVLGALDGPWSPGLSTTIVTALRSHPQPQIALGQVDDLLLARLHPSARTDVERWRAARDGAETAKAVDARLRRIVQQLTTRSSISEAFA